MFELLLLIPVVLLVFVSIFLLTRKPKETSEEDKNRLQKLWKVAQAAMTTKKFAPAERALLAILKIDHKNAAAYNRLGILYAKQENYGDAIECFEVASSIDPKASSLHNLGLIYMETEQMSKAAKAFEKALELEPQAARYIAFAKVKQKMGKPKEVIKALDKAVELEPNPQTLTLLAEAYEANKMKDKAKETMKRLETVTLPETPKPTSKSRPRRAQRVQ